MSVVKLETKSLLAKLLATENITVQHNPGVKTAMFDLKNRVLILPIWENISNDLQDLLLGHETGHALDTPQGEYRAAIDTISTNVFGSKVSDRLKATVAGFLNVIEDARIDKRQKRRYPGLRKNYLNGYKELLERDFFGTQGRDVNSMNFIDRANLYFKGGNVNLDLKFTPQERTLLNRIDNLETFPDVVALTEEIYLYCKSQMENEADTALEDLFAEEGEDGENEMEMDYDDFGSDGNDSDSDSSEGEDGDGEGEDGSGDSDGEGEDSDSDVNKGKGQGDEEDDSADKDSSSSNAKPKKGSDKDKGQNKQSQPGKGAGESEVGSIPKSHTNETYERKMETLVKDEKNQFVYVNFPKINWNKAVNDYKRVLKDWKEEIVKNTRKDDWYINTKNLEIYRKEFTEWRMKEKDTVSFMVSEFERKKAAEMYSRIRTAKTGVIDMTKTYSYKYNEDLFRRVSTIPTGKNHGFVMIVDWSGSMHSNLLSTLKQLLSLCLFCKQIQVPFEVYAFKDAGAESPFSFYGVNNCLKPGRVVLRNFLSSKMKTDEFNFAATVLWAMGRGCNVGCDGLGGTPLNEAIIVAPKVINDFRKANKLEIVNTIFLTDGEGNNMSSVLENDNTGHRRSFGSGSRRHFYNDPETGKTYEFQLAGYYGTSRITPVLLQMLKDKTDSNLVGFYLSDEGFSRMSRRFGIHNAEAKSFWRENKYYPVKSEGYDEYYVIDVPSMSNTTNELTFDDKAKTTKQLAKAFGQFTTKKSVNRVLLRQFIRKVSGEEQKKYG